MNYYCFNLKKEQTIDEIWEKLTSEGFNFIYSEEDLDGHRKLFGYFPNSLTLNEIINNYSVFSSIEALSFDQIDWHAQWGAPDNQSAIELSLQAFNSSEILKMIPGPGFGDLSHPTTRLALQMIASEIPGKYLIDLGCGSGILSLAALKLGALAAWGIDIDQGALEHAKKNAVLNCLEADCYFEFSQKSPSFPASKPIILAMNMISSEQKKAWSSISHLHHLPQIVITSGILSMEKDDYLKTCQERGWHMKATTQEGNWRCFKFLTK